MKKRIANKILTKSRRIYSKHQILAAHKEKYGDKAKQAMKASFDLIANNSETPQTKKILSVHKGKGVQTEHLITFSS